MKLQCPVSNIDTWVDTDDAGFRVHQEAHQWWIGHDWLTLGKKGWSTTQSVTATLLRRGIVLWDGEMGRPSPIGLSSGIMGDLGVKPAVIVRTDSSAAFGVAQISGRGKIRHIEN